ncbi:esterase-like activity of phytase family protein [Hoeflea sp. TYP-13]|uniref:esterase-like activity of phytase family protein n=1 Tax=Hoeflea sp. TYP-13 TaxID=3230023 RepID=UPI0034C66A5E
MIARTALMLVAVLGMAPAQAGERDAGVRQIIVEGRQIPNFKGRSSEKRFGDLEFVGGMEISSPDRILGGISAMRLLKDGVHFVGVMDTGHFISGRLDRDKQGRLSGVSDFVVAPMRSAGGNVISQRWKVDAEGLALNGDNAYVSFERDHRIERYRLNDLPDAAPEAKIPHPIPNYEFRNNRGMEAIAISPADSPLAGALVVVSEKSLDKKGDIFAAVVNGPKRGVFFVRRYAPYDITDGDFLPNGDLLVLERSFSLAGIGMRIRRIAAADIAPGKTVDGDVVIEADFGFQIDNMESLDVYKASDGGTRIMLASDDNHSLLQRSLLLEFKLLDSM